MKPLRKPKNIIEAQLQVIKTDRTEITGEDRTSFLSELKTLENFDTTLIRIDDFQTINWYSKEIILPKNYQKVIIAFYPAYLKGKGESTFAKFEDGIFVDLKSDVFLNIEQDEILYWQPLPVVPNINNFPFNLEFNNEEE